MAVTLVGCALIAVGVSHSHPLLDMASTPPDSLGSQVGEAVLLLVGGLWLLVTALDFGGAPARAGPRYRPPPAAKRRACRNRVGAAGAWEGDRHAPHAPGHAGAVSRIHQPAE